MMLAVALMLAPALMHVTPGVAAPRAHHAMPLHDHPAAHTQGAHDHPATPDDAVACLACVLCVGATEVAPGAAMPDDRAVAVQPAGTAALATREPEPGVRPPQS